MTDEAVNKSPAGWEMSLLGAVCSKITDGSHNPPKKQEAGLPMLSAVNINDNAINFDQYRFINPDDFEREDKRTSVNVGDVLVTIVGTIGRCAVVPEKHERFTLQRSVAVLKPMEVDPRFLMYQIEAGAAQKYLRDNAKGTAQKGVYLRTLSALPLTIAPLSEQQRIVEKIETLFARLDKGEEAVREVQKLLTRYRQSVLKSAVTGQLTADWRAENNASAWDEIELGDITDFLTSGSRGWAKYYADAGDIFIRAQNLKFDRLDLDDIAFVSLPEKSEGKRTRVQKGDLLITITGANVTKTALVDEDIGTAYVSQHVALFRPVEGVSPEFLYWFIVAAAAGRKQLEDFAYGAGKPGLNLTNIREVKLNLPSLQEQLVIVDRLTDALSRQAAIQAAATEQLKRSAFLRQSILKDAFAGRLVPQDPADEPASALLARIADAKAPTKKTRRKVQA